MSRFKMSALLICPDRGIAEQLRATALKAGTFDISADLTTYPAPETVETRMRQARADALLIDVATNLDSAAALIKHASGLNPHPPIIALHGSNDSAAILRSLRCGAHEFFSAPFEASVQEAAIARLNRIVDGSGTAERERGRLIVFTGAKPGSGVSTLAAQMAFALKKGSSSRRVLLADLNSHGGSLGFLLALDHERSVMDLLRQGVRITPELWHEVVVQKDGVDVLIAPEFPEPGVIDSLRLQSLLDWARGSYEWVVADLPVVFRRSALLCMSAADHSFLVCTPELAGLHLTRRAVKLLQQLEFDSSRFQVLVNRMDGKSELNSSDLSKIFDCRVDRGMPGDRTGVMRGIRDAAALDAASPLGRAVGALADKIAGVPADKQRRVLTPSTKTAVAHV